MRMTTDEFFAEFGNRGLCGLCGNTGKLDTRNRAISPVGIDAGGAFFCLCPNGRTMKKSAVKKAKAQFKPIPVVASHPQEFKTYHPNSKEVYFGPYWEDHCPGCGEKANSGCRCLVNSRSCRNGHEWYRDKQGHAIAGSGH